MRKLRTQSSNPLTDISELQVYAEQSGESENVLTVFSDLRLASSVEELKGRDFRYGPRKATLAFTISGCQPTKRPRMNDASGESSVTTETFSQTVIHEKSSGVSAGGGLNLDVSGIVPKLDLNANLAGKTTAVSQLDTSTTKTKTNRQVRPLPNLRWEIEARNPADPNSFLDDSYLAGQEMFSAGIVEGTNHVSIDGVIYCRKKEFGIIAVDKKIYDGFNGPKNREAIMSIVLQKAIKDADTSSGMLGEEFLILSRCKVTDMDF